MQLQQDRIIGNGAFESYDQQKAQMSAVNAVNWNRPPLPPSPCIKIKATGEIHEWSSFFADRPDLCENCDENGNTDPKAWQGRVSAHYKDNIRTRYDQMPMAPVPDSEEAANSAPQKTPPLPDDSQPPLTAPPGLHFNMQEFEAGLLPTDVPQVSKAHLVLGVAPVQEYAQTGSVKAAMPLLDSGNVPIGELIKSKMSQY